ncbi:DUF2723 domain-containing protein [uncultured Acetobacteroides sp.]|uniref:glycosyltransferase family 117 protein n=1 Tax=uncultured Acetobacteroides sp. TaxID=1760811 RepID=UPI0029F56BEF|nr:DUF2723 domain-containing protein [uncultured Acetobacteroides sp.]
MKSFKFYNLLVGWITFAIAAVVYLLSIEPSGSYWDCSEFIATAFKIQVGHPPGAPLFMIIARFFTLFAGGNLEHVAVTVNVMSALASAFTILFLFWTITHLARRIYARTEELNPSQIFGIIGAGVVGALAYTFSDTFWFSAVEGEVYAMSSLFTAVVFWAILKWENDFGKPFANRWLVLIAYLMGLSIGVHLLNLLAIPAIVFVYYFKTYKVTKIGVLKSFGISALILGGILYGIIPGFVKVGSWFELLFVNSMGLPFNSGFFSYLFLLVGGLIWGVYYTYKHGKVIGNTIILCVSVIMIGYSSYSMIVVRAFADTPINENDPENVFALINYLNREQYGDRPLVKGQYFSAPVTSQTPRYSYTKNAKTGKYDKFVISLDYTFNPQFETIFPRMYSAQKDHVDQYMSWGNIKGKQVMITNEKGEEEAAIVPTFGENLNFFFTYQVGYMYMRYFMWNFVGRQNDIQGQGGGGVYGNWISGIPFIDKAITGSDQTVDYMKGNKGTNKYYFLPLILGLIGIFYQVKRDPKNAFVVGLLFFLTGLAIVLYLNQTPLQPRERDYAYAGSFYAFTIWIGLAVLSIQEFLDKRVKGLAAPALATGLCLFAAPMLMGSQTWDDHDRSNRYMAEDFAYNYLQSTLPNSIIITNGDNDTFPLWFQQEVKDVRTDVRIMNTSLLGTDWYIDQMKKKAYKSMPLPITIPHDKYVQGVNDQIIVDNRVKGYHDAKEVMDFILDSDPSTKIPYDNELLSYSPTSYIKIPVNKKNAIASGIVAAKDASKMVDTLYINIEKRYLSKSDFVVLDILAHYQWDRPIYVVSPGGEGDLGFSDYLQFDGFAYRLVPIKTPYNKSSLDAGRVDTDVLYNNLMKKYRWGTINNPNIYIDQNMTRTVVQVLRIRDMFSKLAAELIKEGKMAKALEVQDRGMALVPFSMYAPEFMPYSIAPIVENYYKLGRADKANRIAEEMLVRNVKTLSFFLKLDPKFSNNLNMEKVTGFQGMLFVSEVVKKYNQPALYKKYEAALQSFYPYVAPYFQQQAAQPTDSVVQEQE